MALCKEEIHHHIHTTATIPTTAKSITTNNLYHHLQESYEGTLFKSVARVKDTHAGIVTGQPEETRKSPCHPRACRSPKGGQGLSELFRALPVGLSHKKRAGRRARKGFLPLTPPTSCWCLPLAKSNWKPVALSQ